MSGKSKFLIFIVLLVGAYVAAWLPARYQSEEREKKFSEEWEALQTEFDRMREDLANTQDRLQAAVLGSRLELMIIDVEQKNLGQARERASTFFNDLQDLAFSVVDEKMRACLKTLLQQRDDVIADLTASSPETASRLRKLYTEFSQILTPREDS